jgi:hypothetical protein
MAPRSERLEHTTQLPGAVTRISPIELERLPTKP